MLSAAEALKRANGADDVSRKKREKELEEQTKQDIIVARNEIDVLIQSESALGRTALQYSFARFSSITQHILQEKITAELRNIGYRISGVVGDEGQIIMHISWCKI